VSIFDASLVDVQVHRSNQRRKAMVMPSKKGAEMYAKIQKEMEE
jgi:hypothetical protein